LLKSLFIPVCGEVTSATLELPRGQKTIAATIAPTNNITKSETPMTTGTADFSFFFRRVPARLLDRAPDFTPDLVTPDGRTSSFNSLGLGAGFTRICARMLVVVPSNGRRPVIIS